MDDEAMRDSRVEWVGPISRDWRKDKIFRLAQFISSGGTPRSTSEEFYGGDIVWIQTGDLDNDYIYESSKLITSEGLKNSSAKIFPKNTLLIAMYGATIGKLGILGVEATTNQACCAIYFSRKLHIKFGFYLFMAMKDYLVFQSYGGGQPNISQEIIKQQYIYYPTFSNQRAIAEYLDQRCNKLDAIIAIKQKQIKALDALRQSIIYQAVTKGLDASAPMVDSGVEWLGLVPVHWKISKLRYEISLKNGDFISDKLDNESEYPVVGGNGFMGRTDSFNVEGDIIVIGRVGAYCGNVHYINTKAWVSDNALIVDTKNNKRYFTYLLNAFNLNSIANKTAQPVVTATNIKAVYVTIPIQLEQQSIVEHLDKEIQRLDQLKTNLYQQISTLEVYKKSLIYECVTGKKRIAPDHPGDEISLA